MASVNKVILVGNLGKDPETKTFDGGGFITAFSIATTENYTDKNNQKVSKTDWHNVKAINNNFAKDYLKKGNSVYVEGKISNREYTDANGVKKFITEIVALSIQNLSPKNSTTEGGSTNTTKTSSKAPKSKDEAPTVSSKELNDIANADDDLPF